MAVRSELHDLGNRLGKVEEFTYSHNYGNVAKTLNVTIVRDFERPFEEAEQDDRINVSILGNREWFRVTDTGIGMTNHDLTLLSSEIDIAYQSATKELRFMSMDALEEKEFMSYVKQDGSDINLLPYKTYIKRFHYKYDPYGVTEVVGGWWAFGKDDAVLETLAKILGLRVVCTLPPYRIRQFSVPMGSSIYQAMVELVAVFNANIFIKDNTLYILEPNKTYSWSGRLKIKKALNINERRLYKENTNPEDVIMEAGSGIFNPERYEGPIFPTPLISAFPITIGAVTLGQVPLLSYETWPEPETTVQQLFVPGYGVTKSNETISYSMWDIFHSRKIRYYSKNTDYIYNYIQDTLIPSTIREDYFRYRYLESCYNSSRLDSGEELTLYPMLEAGMDIPGEIRTHSNWCRLSRIGALQWVYDGELKDYKHILQPDSELEFEWRFYDKYGRLAMRSTRIYADVHTFHYVPHDYNLYRLENRASVPWRKYNSLTYAEGSQLSGTLVRIIPDVNDPVTAFDERTIILDEIETYTPMGNKRFKVTQKRIFLDEGAQRRRTEVTTREISSDEVETIPIKPRESQIVINNFKGKQAELVEKPLLHVSAPNVWIESEALEIYEYLKKHISSQEIERTIELPYSLYVPRGAAFDFGEMENYRGKTIVPDRGIDGNVVSYSVNRNSEGATTMITAKGILP